MEEQKKEITEVELNNTGLVEATDDIIASAERRIANLQKVITLALKVTNQNDWVDFHGKPFLASSGCQKVARLFGVCWKDMKTDKIISEDEKGKFYFYKTTGLFFLNGKNDLVEATGTCSSKDQFFGQVRGEMKPLSEIDETNILKASITNCISNGITSLLGLKNLTWEQVKEGGVTKESTAQVKYANGGAGGGLISQPQAKRLFAIAKQMDRSDDDIKSYLKTHYKIEKTSEIKRADYDKICEVLGSDADLEIDSPEVGQ